MDDVDATRAQLASERGGRDDLSAVAAGDPDERAHSRRIRAPAFFDVGPPNQPPAVEIEHVTDMKALSRILVAGAQGDDNCRAVRSNS